MINQKHQISIPNFSPHKEHALRDHAGIFRHTEMNDQGWFTGRDGELLFWLPPKLRYAFFLPGNKRVFPRGPEVDASKMLHGDGWHNIYVEDVDC